MRKLIWALVLLWPAIAVAVPPQGPSAISPRATCSTSRPRRTLR